MENKYTKKEIIKKLLEKGFSDIVKYNTKGEVINYQLGLVINKIFK